MNNDGSINKRDFSLFELLLNYQVCIPIIQREYIQGIDDKKRGTRRKMQKMLDDILLALITEQKLNLSIIYGNHENNIFYPIDGQQRLTMLYLLQWYFAIRDLKMDNLNEFYKLNLFSYETKISSNEFFRFLSDYKNRQLWTDVFKDLNKKDNFLIKVQSKTWFKAQWFIDITVISAINIISEFIKKIHIGEMDNLNKYYLNLKNGIVCFDFLSEAVSNAENNSSISYICLNSRGKQLEQFECIKSMLSIIENRFNDTDYNKFVYKYDQKYIDVFYNNCNSEFNLEVKTKEINKKSITLLLNTYNLLKFVRYENGQVNTDDDFYDILFKQSKIELTLDFWKEYFNFLNSLLSTVYNDIEISNFIEKFWNETYIYSQHSKSDKDNLIAYVLYIHYYSIFHQNSILTKLHLKKLRYILKNLRYGEWKQNRFNFIKRFCIEYSKFENIFEYFVQYDVDRIIADIGLNNKENYKNISIDDIEMRIKEQCVKSKIIYADSSMSYDYFENIERLSDRKQIYYLFYISNMWDNDIDSKKIEVLKQYIEIAKTYFCNNKNDLNWRKYFAFVTCYDDSNNILFDVNKINEMTNKKYIEYENERNFNDSTKKYYNLHYWNDNYYFCNDNINKNQNLLELRKLKLSLLKKAYDLLLYLKNQKKTINELYKILNDDIYNECWLKYAIDRNYAELFTNLISYNTNTSMLKIDVNCIGYIDNKRGNFFAHIYSLDTKKKNKNFELNRYKSLVWDYKSKKVASKIEECGVLLYTYLVNQFNTSIIWFKYRERWIKDNIYKEYNRYFFYCLHKLSFNLNEDETILIEGNNISIVRFLEAGYLKKYVINMDDIHNKVAMKIEQFDLIVSEYNDNNTNFEQNFEIERRYIFNGNQVTKYRYKDEFGATATLSYENFELDRAEHIGFEHFNNK